MVVVVAIVVGLTGWTVRKAAASSRKGRVVELVNGTTFFPGRVVDLVVSSTIGLGTTRVELVVVAGGGGLVVRSEKRRGGLWGRYGSREVCLRIPSF